MRNYLRYVAILLFLVYLSLVGFLCFANPEGYPSVDFSFYGIPGDKLVHFLLFTPYPILAYLILDVTGKSFLLEFASIVVIFITGAIIAFGTEKIQGMTEYRSFEKMDLLADIAGLMVSSFLVFVYILIHRIKHNNEE